MAVAGISRALLKVASKAAKKYIKQNPGKSNVDVLENLQKNFDFDVDLTRLKKDNTRNVTKRAASRDGDNLIKNIFTKNQLHKIRIKNLSANKIDQYKQGIMGTEAHLKNLSNAQKRQIKESIETGIESKNPVVSRLVDLYNTGYSKPGEKTYIKAQDAFAKELGLGSRKKLRNDPNFNEAFQKRRVEMQMLYHQGMADDLTPAGDILTKYPRHGYEGVMDKRSALNEMAFGDELYPFLKNELNLSKSQIAAGMGHEYPIAQLAKIIAEGGRPDMSTLRAIQLASNPKNIKSELNFMNQAKNRGIENFLYSGNMYADKLNPLSNLMKNAQMSSKFYSPTGVRQQIGTTADEIDPKQLLQFLKYIQKDQPYGLTKKGNLRYLPNQDYIKRLLRGEEKEFNFARGGKVDGYAAGGVGRLGLKMLSKLAKKLSPKEMKMLTSTGFKGTNPSKSLAKKREANLMKKLGDNYNWRNVKSTVPGPTDVTRRSFMKGIGALAGSTALPKGLANIATKEIAKKIPYAPPWVNSLIGTLKKTPLHTADFNFAKVGNNAAAAKIGSKAKKIYGGGTATETHFRVKSGANRVGDDSRLGVEGQQWDDIILTEEPGQTSLTWKNKSYDHGNDQHVVIDHKNKETRFVDDNWHMEAGGEDIAKDDWVEYAFQTDKGKLEKELGVFKGDVDDGMIDYQSVNDMDGYYADTFQSYVDSFSPSGNMFGTVERAQLKLQKEQVRKLEKIENDRLVREMKEDQMAKWEEEFRGGFGIHGYSKGGIMNLAEKVK